MKRSGAFLLLLLFVGINSYSFGQKENPKLDFSADVMSRYIWRGSQFGGNSPSLQPSVNLSWNGLELGAWGAYSLGGTNNAQEFDLYLGYTFLKDLMSITLTDYYFPIEGANYDYFEFNHNKTGHVLEGTIGFNGNEKIPFGFLLAVNFWGADAASISEGSSNINQKTGIQYSTYAEISYSHSMSNDVDFNTFIGFNLTDPKTANPNSGFNGESGYYGSKAGIVNLGCTLTKNVEINDKFSLPVSASIITNPVDKKIFFVFGFSL
ncbi:TorF family putative porin [Ancylomarina longa]|uniref:Uncharacterized protein n=1 Tax=Ancylomarina longa TaxID=2487017 RepID=A0A434AXA2_9BACT|nr:TorF family putative porin [Ancylomarina longa]RUT79166.1 hypothetical protein DLK05_04945 [Ancylomarina longa]